MKECHLKSLHYSSHMKALQLKCLVVFHLLSWLIGGKPHYVHLSPSWPFSMPFGENVALK